MTPRQSTFVGLMAILVIAAAGFYYAVPLMPGGTMPPPPLAGQLTGTYELKIVLANPGQAVTAGDTVPVDLLVTSSNRDISVVTPVWNLTNAELMSRDTSVAVQFPRVVGSNIGFYRTDRGGQGTNLRVVRLMFKFPNAGAATVGLREPETFVGPFDNGIDLAVNVIPLSITVQPASTLSNGLIGYWKFDEGQGTTAADASNAGNNATLANGAAWATGKVGNAVSLDGVNDSVNVPDSDSLTPAHMTATAWVRFADIPSQTDTARAIFGKRVNWRQQDERSLLLRKPGDRGAPYGLNARTGGAQQTAAEYALQPQLNKWYHVAAVYGPTTIQLYVDGTAVGTARTTSQVANGTAPLTIGSLNGSSFFKGLIDEFRLYNRALSATEIETLAR